MRIVIATGDTDLRLAIQLILSEEPGIKIIGSVSDFVGLKALVNSTFPDFVILDWSLPDCSMEKVLPELKAEAVEPEITLIVIGTHHRLKETVLQAGADDYVVIGDPPTKLLEAFRQHDIE